MRDHLALSCPICGVQLCKSEPDEKKEKLPAFCPMRLEPEQLAASSAPIWRMSSCGRGRVNQREPSLPVIVAGRASRTSWTLPAALGPSGWESLIVPV
jgi:hypothetical protein